MRPYKRVFNENYGIHIIKNPAGTYHFVGTIPIDLAYMYINDPNKKISKEDADALNLVGPGMIAKKRGIKARTFSSKKEAENFKKKMGY